jgi:hypothetical protein
VSDPVRRHLEPGEHVLHAFPARSGPDPNEPGWTVVELLHDLRMLVVSHPRLVLATTGRILLVRASWWFRREAREVLGDFPLGALDVVREGEDWDELGLGSERLWSEARVRDTVRRAAAVR